MFRNFRPFVRDTIHFDTVIRDRRSSRRILTPATRSERRTEFSRDRLITDRRSWRRRYLLMHVTRIPLSSSRKLSVPRFMHHRRGEISPYIIIVLAYQTDNKMSIHLSGFPINQMFVLSRSFNHTSLMNRVSSSIRCRRIAMRPPQPRPLFSLTHADVRVRDQRGWNNSNRCPRGTCLQNG